jgi:hypothetical protein
MIMSDNAHDATSVATSSTRKTVFPARVANAISGLISRPSPIVVICIRALVDVVALLNFGSDSSER